MPSDQPSGQVVAQNPAAGSDAPEGSTVRLNVAQKAEASPLPTTTGPVATAARRPEPPTVPDVVGEELADAARAFGDEVLKVSVQYVPSDEPQGRVVAQAQPAGTELEPGDTVQVNVSNGPDPAADDPVPDVVGLSRLLARERLSTGAASRCSRSRSRAPHGRTWSRSRPPAARRSRAARSCCSTSARG